MPCFYLSVESAFATWKRRSDGDVKHVHVNDHNNDGQEMQHERDLHVFRRFVSPFGMDHQPKGIFNTSLRNTESPHTPDNTRETCSSGFCGLMTSSSTHLHG